MSRSIIKQLIIVGIIFPQFLFGNKIFLKKKINPIPKHKIHPIERYLSQNNNFSKSKNRYNSKSFNKLLVLLVDFQEDDDPQTTGSGKFLQDATNYPISLGSPPHDIVFFEAQLSALNYYYRAVSMEQYDLEYDVFPKPDSTGAFRAITLPHEMAYYNQLNASEELMLERFEEYFHDIFSRADQISDIDFSDYAHFMIIHAGSDWQHDTKSDSPYDIPSFFMQMGEGKEIYVDDGSVMVDHACNIPEMITQDITVDSTNTEYNTIYGYGLINAVMAHEFGHSLGYVDVYNVRNFRTVVGVFDIMDSGGSGLLGVSEGNSVYYLEGGLPALPGAWTRLLVPQWTDFFLEQGFLKEVSSLDFDKDITLEPAESKPDYGIGIHHNPYFIKIPLNSEEYILLENRQVDPDGDGGTSVVGTLPITPGQKDYRVILHPSSMIIGDDEANYEYDYLLPGWQNSSGFYGGGILAWHIDNGVIYADDNFTNNTINTSYSKPGVKIIEADDIDDLGNPYSYFWTGTAYDYYYKYMPRFDSHGFFLGWDDETISNPDGEITFLGHYANSSLSTTSKPPLITNSGNPVFYKIYDISDYSLNAFEKRSMTLKIGSNFFDQTIEIAEIDSLTTIAKATDSYLSEPFLMELPIFSQNKVSFFTHLFTPDDESWIENSITIPVIPNSDVVTVDSDNDGFEEYQFTNGNEFFVMNDTGIIEHRVFDSDICDRPFFLSGTDRWTIPTQNKLFIGDDIFEIPNTKITSNGSDVFAISGSKYYKISMSDNEYAISNTIDLAETCGQFQPVYYQDMENSKYNCCIFQADSGSIYKIDDSGVTNIFNNKYHSENVTQLALGAFGTEQNIYVAFGTGNRIYAIDIFGTLQSGFPKILDENVSDRSFPHILCISGKYQLIIDTESGIKTSIDNRGELLRDHSFKNMCTDVPVQFFYEELSERLYYIYASQVESQHKVFTSLLGGVAENPIIWNGENNNNYSIYRGIIQSPAPEEDFYAYSFPNPAKNGELRIKIQNAPADIDLNIFDIAGNIVLKKSITKRPSKEQDFVWNIAGISSGVYFGIVKSADLQTKISIAIEK